MKGNKIITTLIIINITTIGIIYNFIKKDYLNNEKIIVKAMTEAEYDNSIKSLNKSHEEYAKYIEESKTKIASAITDMGVATSNDATPETMSNNIKSIAKDASSISYDNTNSGLTSTNVQGAVDELNNSFTNKKIETLWTGNITTPGNTEYTLSQNAELFDILLIDFGTMGADGKFRNHTGVISKGCITNQKNDYDLNNLSMCSVSIYAHSSWTAYLGLKIKEDKFKAIEIIIGANNTSANLFAIYGINF